MTPGHQDPNSTEQEAQQSSELHAAGTVGGVQILHERPAPETEPHVIAPIFVVLADGTRLAARKWSLSGISDPILDGHDLSGARLEIPFQGIEVGFPVRLVPKSVDGPWMFNDLTGRQREALGLFYKNLLTGKMAATDHVITALDTPVDLIPMGETDEEKSAGQANAKPRLLRTVLNILWYVGLFALVVGFLGSVAWNRIEGIKLSHARVYAERQDLQAPREGFLHRHDPAMRPVDEGTLLATLDDPEITAALADVQSRIGVLETRIADGRERLAVHLSLRDTVRDTLGRLYSEAAMARFDAGISIRPGDYNDQRAEIEQELRGFETDLAKAQAELRTLRQQQTSMRIPAPTGGLLVEWMAHENQYLRPGDTIAIFETAAPRVVRGWLDDRASGSVQPGMAAEIRLAGRGQDILVPGRVTQVEAGANPSEPDVYGMIVTVEAVDLDLAETRAQLQFNAPADVVVKRGLLARWFGSGD